MNSIIQENLKKAYENAPELSIRDEDKILILSDFHIGGRKGRDEFRKNAPLIFKALGEWYLPKEYKLILNGDIEELHRVSLRTVSNSWKDLYALFRDFRQGPGLYKIRGNHDYGADHYWKTGRSIEEREGKLGNSSGSEADV